MANFEHDSSLGMLSIEFIKSSRTSQVYQLTGSFIIRSWTTTSGTLGQPGISNSFIEKMSKTF
jgi:hypothetical protein